MEINCFPRVAAFWLQDYRHTTMSEFPGILDSLLTSVDCWSSLLLLHCCTDVSYLLLPNCSTALLSGAEYGSYCQDLSMAVMHGLDAHCKSLYIK